MTPLVLLTASARWLTTIALLPLFGSGGRALLTRIAFALPLLVIALPFTLPDAQLALLRHPLAPTLLRELLIGLILGLVAFTLFSTAHLVGALFDAPASLSPHSGHARLITLLTLAIALFANAHILFIEALVTSYQSVPIGHSPDASTLSLLSPLFTVALAASAPLLFSLLCAELGLGWALHQLQPQPAQGRGATRQLLTTLLIVASLPIAMRVLVSWISNTLLAGLT